MQTFYSQKHHFKHPFLAAGLIFSLVGIIFLCVSIFLFTSSARFLAASTPVEGTIERISGQQVFVSYQVEGEEYSSRLNFYSSAMRTGEPIQLYYDNGNPAVVRTPSSQFLNWIFLAVGILLAAVGLLLVILQARGKNRNQKLLETGMRLDAEIVNIGVNPRISSNYRHPYILGCQYVAPDGSLYQFRSGPIWQNPEHFLTSSQVSVYVDRNNYGRYYVDLSSVLPPELL